MKKLFSIILCLCIVFMGFSALAEYPVYDDIQNHWAKETIEAWSNKGIVKGYDGKFRPDDFITRGEFAVVLNRILLFDEPAENTFDDLKESFYTAAVLCLNKQGIMNGFEKNIRPDDFITREEAAVMLFKAMKLETKEISALNFNDEDEISDWAKPYMTSLVNEGVFKGYNGCLRPKDNITRAETASLIDSGVFMEDDKAADKALEEDSEEAETDTENEDTESNNSYIAEEEFEEVWYDDYSEDEEYAEDEEDITEEIPEELKPVIETTLEDGLYQQNSRKVFDVIARDVNGNKIECRVNCNDINIEPSWDDEVKTSFTLEFSENGEYTVEITATDDEGISQTCTYTITYEAVQYGEPIGKATVCIEAFTVGGGYIVAPYEIDVSEGVNCAYLLDEILTENNLSYMNTGSLDGGFYLASVSDIPQFTPVISETLYTALTDAGFNVDEESFTPGVLSEFDFTQGSGWMYCVNGVFPNVGFSEYYLQDGDVMRIQFTLAYGSDIGGASGAGFTYAGDFYEMVNRDALTKILSKKSTEDYVGYMDIICKPDITQDELDELMNQIG